MTARKSRTAHEILASSGFFREALDEGRIAALAGGLRLSRYRRGATLIREDDLGASMFVLAEGEAEVSIPASPRDRVVATLKAGDIFGEMSLLTGARRAATVTARTDVEAVEIPKSAIAPLIAASPDLADRFATVLEKRQAELDRIYRGGGGRWTLPRGGELAGLIRGFFGGTV